MAYQGLTVPLPIATQGFSGSKNPSRMGPGHLVAVEGLSLEGDIIQREGGTQKVNTNALGGGATVIAGISWAPDPATQHDIIFLDDGDVLRDAGAGTFATSLATGLVSVRVPPPVFVSGGGETVGASRKMFMFSASNQVKVVAGTASSMASISDPAADWSTSFPTFGVQHAGRMWAGGNSSDPHRVYASLSSDHEDFVSAGFLSFAVFPGEGEQLVGGISYRGVLVLFKHPRGIYVVDTRNTDSANWTVNRLSGSVGAINQGSIIQIENDVLYMDEGGNIHMLSATNAFGDINTSNVSQIADISSYVRSEVNLSEIRRAVGIWYAAKRQAWFSLPGVGETDNSIRLAVDFNRPDIGPRFLPSRRDTLVSLWNKPDTNNISRPTSGDDLGFVWEMDSAARNKDGSAYELRLETANTDLGFADQQLATKMKSVEFLEIVAEPRGNWDMTVEIWLDDQLTDTVQFDMGSGAAAIGDFELDTDVLSSAVVSSERQRITGSGRRMRLVMYNDGADEDVAIAAFYLSFKVMDERVRQSS